MLLAGQDDEVNHLKCERLAKRTQELPNPGPLDFHTYPNATHNFDDPSGHDPNNATASADAQKRAKAFFKKHLEAF
jgi:dienelactone hydrolase